MAIDYNHKASNAALDLTEFYVENEDIADVPQFFIEEETIAEVPHFYIEGEDPQPEYPKQTTTEDAKARNR